MTRTIVAALMLGTLAAQNPASLPATTRTLPVAPATTRTLPVAPATSQSSPVAPATAQTSPVAPATDCQETAAAIRAVLANDARTKDWPQLGRYRQANSALAAPKPGEPRVVFMGDSITDAWQQDRFGFF